MLKDRGSKKWTAMMLTEHVSDLRQWYESDNDIPEPQYDEFSLNALAEDLNIAYHAKTDIRISYWSNKRFSIYEGHIIALLPNDQAIRIGIFDFNHKLFLKNMIKLDILN